MPPAWGTRAVAPFAPPLHAIAASPTHSSYLQYNLKL